MSIGALVSYRGRAAEIIAAGEHYGNKVLIRCDDGEEIKVRQKDFRLIHPEYQLLDFSNQVAEPDLTILADFYGQTLSLSELTQWLFDDNTPQNAWQTYLLIVDGLYFQWQQQAVLVRPQEQVEAIVKKRKERALTRQKQQAFIKRVAQQTWCEEDNEFLTEIENVALNQRKHSDIIKALKLENTPQEAHRLLLTIGYWSAKHYPYLERNKISQSEQIEADAVLKSDGERSDLTHLNSYAIDNKNSKDADDALSIDGDRIWIHIADVASVIPFHSPLDDYAQKRASALYLPDQTCHMLPNELIFSLSLTTQQFSNALSIGFNLTDQGAITDIAINCSQIKVKRLSYDEVDNQLSSVSDFKALARIAEKHRVFRSEQGAIKLDLPKANIRYVQERVIISAHKTTPAKEMVAEFMIMAGRAAALFATEHNISLPFLSQAKPTQPIKVEPQSLSQQFAIPRQLAKSATNAKMNSHTALGLEGYVRITSPLRRYLDLLAQQQLLAHIKQQPLLDKKSINQAIFRHNQVMSRVRRTSFQCDLHAKINYLMQNPMLKLEAVVIEKHDKSVKFAVILLALLTEIKVAKPAEFVLDESYTLRVKKLDLATLAVEFICR